MSQELIGRIIGIKEFQKGIEDGLYSDEKGRARILINGDVANTYAVHINRRIISSAGSIVTFRALLKEHGSENLMIEYEERPPRLPNLEEYIRIKNDKGNSKKYRK